MTMLMNKPAGRQWSQELTRRACLAHEIYELATNTDLTFYGKTGGDLAYLMGGILGGRPGVLLSRKSNLYKALAHLPANHEVWASIELKP